MIIGKKALVAAIGASLGLGAAVPSAQAATLTSLVITSGTWAMGVFTPVPNTITDFSGANLIAGAIAPTFDTSVAHTSAQASSPIAWDFNGGGIFVNTFTTAASSGDEAGGVMSGTIAITINYFFRHSDPDQSVAVNMDQSGSFTGTGDGSNFSINWTSQVLNGPFIGQIGTYNISGTYAVAAVPVPAAAWLMGSGLVGLVGVARRKK